MYIYIYGHPPPHDRPRPSKHRSHRHVRAFSGVSSLSPPNVSVKNHPTTETKKTKKQISTENAGTVLVFCFFGFWFFGSLFFCFFVFLVLWFFVFFDFLCFLVVWFYCGEGYISKNTKNQKNKNQTTKEPKNQKTKKPNNQKTKNQKNKKTKNQRTKKTKNQNCSSILRGALVFWFFGFGRRVVLHGHVRRAQTRYPGKSRLILILILS